jgi:hypothetical protein
VLRGTGPELAWLVASPAPDEGIRALKGVAASGGESGQVGGLKPVTRFSMLKRPGTGDEAAFIDKFQKSP